MWKNLPYKGCIYFSIILNAVSVIFILVLKRILPPVVPLFYGLPAGADQLTSNLGLLLAPATGFAITAVNVFISNMTRDIFLRRALIISSAFASILLAITVIKIVFLVGFF
jgi:hypothetical protein